MVAVVTRVASADVKIDGKTVGAIGKGFLVLLGVAQGDGQEQAIKLADKICGVRVFEDENGKMNLNLEKNGSGAGQLTVPDFSKYQIMVPPKYLQNQFADYAKTCDKLKFEVEEFTKITYE